VQVQVQVQVQVMIQHIKMVSFLVTRTVAHQPGLQTTVVDCHVVDISPRNALHP
jgi:hypothetical protein